MNDNLARSVAFMAMATSGPHVVKDWPEWMLAFQIVLNGIAIIASFASFYYLVLWLHQGGQR